MTGYNYAPPVAVATNPPSTQPSPSGSATPTVVVAWVFSTTTSATVPSPTITFTGIPAAPSGTSYYAYFYDATQDASQGYSGPLTDANGTITEIPGSNSQGTMLPANDQLVLELVYF